MKVGPGTPKQLNQNPSLHCQEKMIEPRAFRGKSGTPSPSSSPLRLQTAMADMRLNLKKGVPRKVCVWPGFLLTPALVVAVSSQVENPLRALNKKGRREPVDRSGFQVEGNPWTVLKPYLILNFRRHLDRFGASNP